MDANALTCMTIQRHTDRMSLNSSSRKTSEKKKTGSTQAKVAIESTEFHPKCDESGK